MFSEIREIVDDIILKYESEAAKKIKFSSEILNLISDLSKRYKLGIFTLQLSEIVEEILEKYGIDKLFQTIVGRNDVACIKPAPEHLLKVLSEMNIKNSEVMVVGDHPDDLRCADSISAGYIAILKPNFFNINEIIDLKIDFYLHSLADLKKILKI